MLTFIPGFPVKPRSPGNPGGPDGPGGPYNVLWKRKSLL